MYLMTDVVLDSSMEPWFSGVGSASSPSGAAPHAPSMGMLHIDSTAMLRSTLFMVLASGGRSVALMSETSRPRANRYASRVDVARRRGGENVTAPRMG